jgi:hypothetical protein
VNHERWALAGLCLQRVLPPGTDELPRIGAWVVATMGERLDLPPLGVVADLGALLLGHSLSLARRARVHVDDRLDTALRRYEDTVLARVAADARLARAGDAIAKLPPALHAQGIGILCAGVLARAGFDAGVALPPGVVRAAATRDALERGKAALHDDAELRATLAAAYEALVKGAHRMRELVSEADVFALENLAVLGGLEQRLAIAQVVEAADALGRAFPRRIRSTREETGTVATALDDESVYPAGGFSSISSLGSFENLVTSELAYMEPTRGAFDLFDVRYAEGALLYYTRDEAIHVRRRRLVSFVLGDDLARTRVKDAALPWQRVVLVLATVLATWKKLLADLGGEDLRLRVVFTGFALGNERSLLELALREWRDQGLCEVVTATLDEEARTLAAAAPRALVESVLFSAAADPAALSAWRARLEKVRGIATGFAADATDLAGWTEGVVDLVGALL